MLSEVIVDSIQIDADSRAFSRALQSMVGLLADTSPLTADISELLTESTKRRFASGEAPDGTPWVPLADGSGRTPLTLTGTMRDQIFPSSGRDFVEISASAKQARWHQFGTAPYTIKPRAGSVLRFGGRDGVVFVRSVNHPGLPARPFLGLSAQDTSDIDALALAYIDLNGSR